MEKIIVDENHEIIEKHQTLDNLVIVGIKRRGAEIAELIRQKIMALTQVDVPSFDLDITFYRDDLSLIEEEMSPIYKGASMQMNIQNKEIILVDDVLFTGRTIRAALDALTDFGRASRIELVIFVDRGHRELPIRADYVGKNVPTSRNENIQVRTKQFDQCYEVALLSK